MESPKAPRPTDGVPPYFVYASGNAIYKKSMQQHEIFDTEQYLFQTGKARIVSMDFLSSTKEYFSVDESGRLWRNGNELEFETSDGFVTRNVRIDWLNKKLLLFGESIGEKLHQMLICDLSKI